MRRELIEKLHRCEIEIMDEFDRVCKKNNLTYYMVGGTLLGAVRHGGFIPWDDDVDLAMPRRDYNKLLEIADREFSDRFFLQTLYNDPGYENRFAKIRMNNTLFVEESLVNTKRHHGIYIDIWPLDEGRENFGFIQRKRKALLTLITWYVKKRGNPDAKVHCRTLARKVMFALLKPFSKETLMRFVEFLMRGKGDCYVNWASQYGFVKQTMKKTVYDPPVKLKFEDKEYFAPREYEFFLRRIYGENYMQLPPVEKRVTHNPVRLSFDTNGPDEILD